MTKTATKPADNTDAKILVVYGVDDSGKPRAARFAGSNPDLVGKAAQAMALAVTEAATDEATEIAKKLPTGRLYSNGKGFVPYVRRDFYAKLSAALGIALSQDHQATAESPAVATGLPRSWDEIAPGHLVIAQENLEYGWWESIVLERNGDMLTLRFRDYPKLPKFVRHRAAVALISTAIAA